MKAKFLKLSVLTIISLMLFNVSVNAKEKDRKIIYKLGNEVIKVENSDKINLPTSNFGSFKIKNQADESDIKLVDLEYEKFNNLDTSKKYVIFRDENNNVIKAFNTDLIFLTNFHLKEFNLDGWQLSNIVFLNSKCTNITLDKKKEERKELKDIKNSEIEVEYSNVNENLKNQEDKNKDLVNVKINFTKEDKIVKTVNANVKKGEKPIIDDFVLEGKKYHINSLLLPNIDEDSELTYPIDNVFLGNGLIHIENVDSNKEDSKTESSTVLSSFSNSEIEIDYVNNSSNSDAKVVNNSYEYNKPVNQVKDTPRKKIATTKKNDKKLNEVKKENNNTKDKVEKVDVSENKENNDVDVQEVVINKDLQKNNNTTSVENTKEIKIENNTSKIQTVTEQNTSNEITIESSEEK